MSKECAMYGNQCEDCPIKEICLYLFDLPFGRTDTDAYLKIYQQGKADAINEFVTRFEEEYSRMAVHLGEFRKYQYEMHRLAEEMLKDQKNE